MNKSSASLMVAIFDQVVCVKICGRANFTSSLDLKRVITELADRGYKRFVLDLSECINMDSTFLGVLAGVGLKYGKETRETPDSGIQLLNPNPRISDLLESLGVAHLFNIVTADQPQQNNFQMLETGHATRADVTRTCLEAHQVLMNINPENVRKFKDVAQFLAEDLKKIEGEEARKP